MRSFSNGQDDLLSIALIISIWNRPDLSLLWEVLRIFSADFTNNTTHRCARPIRNGFPPTIRSFSCFVLFVSLFMSRISKDSDHAALDLLACGDEDDQFPCVCSVHNDLSIWTATIPVLCFDYEMGHCTE